MQEIEIDYDALDASYIPGMEFAFFNTLATIDPFQPITIAERNEIMVTSYGASDGCGTWMHISKVVARINDYYSADEADQELFDDAVAGLVTLGFKTAPSKKAVTAAIERLGPSATLSQVITESLRKV